MRRLASDSATAIGVGLVVSVIGSLALVARLHNPLDRWLQPDTSRADQRYIGLATTDSCFEVVGKPDRPESEEWISAEEDEIQFQALFCPAQR